jgi:hypothetical protein
LGWTEAAGRLLKICKLFFSVLNLSPNSIQNTVSLNSSGIVDSENFYQRILSFVCIFREDAKIVSQESENTPKVFIVFANTLKAVRVIG